MPLSIAISGTPGTGKSAVGQLIASRLDAKLLELGKVVRNQGLFTETDETRDTLIADLESLVNYVTEIITQTRHRCIIVGHFADEIPTNLLEIIVILRCHPTQLTDRLKQRQWSHTKILENIQAEILGECTSQSLQRHSFEKIFEIDTTQKSIPEVVDCIELILSSKSTPFSVGKISWLQTLDAQLLHKIMEEKQLP